MGYGGGSAGHCGDDLSDLTGVISGGDGIAIIHKNLAAGGSRLT